MHLIFIISHLIFQRTFLIIVHWRAKWYRKPLFDIYLFPIHIFPNITISFLKRYLCIFCVIKRHKRRPLVIILSILVIVKRRTSKNGRGYKEKEAKEREERERDDKKSVRWRACKVSVLKTAQCIMENSNRKMTRTVSLFSPSFSCSCSRHCYCCCSPSYHYNLFFLSSSSSGFSHRCYCLSWNFRLTALVLFVFNLFSSCSFLALPLLVIVGHLPLPFLLLHPLVIKYHPSL